MYKEIKSFKIQGYDKFKCIADKCKFTCCTGWDINVDDETVNKLKKCNKKYILEDIMIIDNDGEEQYFLNKETQETCPLLDENGLCNIVKNDGEEYLSLACRSFPRIENNFQQIKEFTLSCACPEVIEIISDMNEKINMSTEESYKVESDLTAFNIRESVVDIIQKANIPLEEKLIISYEILLRFMEEDDEKILELCKNSEYIKELSNIYNEAKINIKDSMEEVNYLFLDISKNYKDVRGLEDSLREIYEYAEASKYYKAKDQWNKYIKDFAQYELLIENCIVSKIFSNCLCNSLEEFVLSFELIILEYILVRYAIFLKWCINNKAIVSIEDVKDYIVVFSRAISSNDEAVFEFLEDGFGDAILEGGYMRFIMM